MTAPGPWQPANNGTGKRIWFLYRYADNIRDRYRYAKDGWRLVRYASFEAAQRAADRLNAEA